MGGDASTDAPVVYTQQCNKEDDETKSWLVPFGRSDGQVTLSTSAEPTRGLMQRLGRVAHNGGRWALLRIALFGCGGLTAWRLVNLSTLKGYKPARLQIDLPG